MLREAVESSNIVSVGYDDSMFVMEVQFKADKYGVGSVYRYAPVTREEYEVVRNAASVGRALLAIKDNPAITAIKVADVIDGADVPLEEAS